MSRICRHDIVIDACNLCTWGGVLPMDPKARGAHRTRCPRCGRLGAEHLCVDGTLEFVCPQGDTPKEKP